MDYRILITDDTRQRIMLTGKQVGEVDLERATIRLHSRAYAFEVGMPVVCYDARRTAVGTYSRTFLNTFMPFWGDNQLTVRTVAYTAHKGGTRRTVVVKDAIDRDMLVYTQGDDEVVVSFPTQSSKDDHAIFLGLVLFSLFADRQWWD